jgi:hypothetical protein
MAHKHSQWKWLGRLNLAAQHHNEILACLNSVAFFQKPRHMSWGLFPPQPNQLNLILIYVVRVPIPILGTIRAAPSDALRGGMSDAHFKIMLARHPFADRGLL